MRRGTILPLRVPRLMATAKFEQMSPLHQRPALWPRRLRRTLRTLFAEPLGLAIGAAANAAVTLLSFWIGPHVQLAHLMILHLIVPVLISTRFGGAVSAFTAISSVLAFDYFCVPPVFAFAFPDTHSILTFVSMLAAALTICFLLQRLRYQGNVARANEAWTRALCELSMDLTNVTRAADVPACADPHLEHLLGPGARVILQTELRALTELELEERAATTSALERRAARFELQDGQTLFLQPIGLAPAPIGLVRWCTQLPSERPSAELIMLLTACADRIGVSLDRIALADVARRAEVEAEAERLRNALLSAVSHDLKTPLASILAAGTALIDRGWSNAHTTRELLETIVEETERLNALLTNILSVTRLESGQVRLNTSNEAFDDLLFSVLSRLSGRIEGRQVELRIPPDLPLIALDAALIDQVLVNLIENALRYTPAGSPLTIELRALATEIVLSICDRGPGISEDEREKVFEKFYRGRQAHKNDGGSGLGLTICRAVAKAHGGQISLAPRAGGGTRVEFSLPRRTLARANVTLSKELSLV